MTILDEAIATRAKTELPETWAKLANAESFGTDGLIVHAETVHKFLFGAVLSGAEQDALDVLVLDYAGKSLALRIIRPGIDYWSKQAIQQTATGREELKAWDNRANELKELQKSLLQELRSIWPDVEILLPARRVVRTQSVPAVEDLPLEVAHTPDPLDFEPPYGPPTAAPGTVQ